MTKTSKQGVIGPLWGEFTGGWQISSHEGPVMRKAFPCNEVLIFINVCTKYPETQSIWKYVYVLKNITAVMSSVSVCKAVETSLHRKVNWTIKVKFVVNRRAEAISGAFCYSNHSENQKMNLYTAALFLCSASVYLTRTLCTEDTQIAKLMEPTWAYLGPVGPRWAQCWPHEHCYQGRYVIFGPQNSIYHTCVWVIWIDNLGES